jgi:hypothetical protein
MKLVLGIALVFGAVSAACYVAPTGAPAPAGSTAKPESAEAAEERVAPSKVVAAMAERGIRTDMPFREAFAEAKAADKKENAERGKGRVSLIMKSFTESLGVECKDCHAQKTDADGEPLTSPEGKPQLDYHAQTEMTAISERMWDEWVAPLRFIEDESQPVFCDSCHQGKAQFLDRTLDEKAMGAWMRTNFNAKFQRVVDDKVEAVKCGTCHDGKPAAFLDGWKTPAQEEEEPSQP